MNEHLSVVLAFEHTACLRRKADERRVARIRSTNRMALARGTSRRWFTSRTVPQR